ncbi:hypothetical protein J3Q64DRAFT_1724421 [Phycomyces blakesleeanus]|uniref:Uncharacterized protein n=1 Tax=Phycomyces blakesleeanus TaxID=4837 RepID=A0ABR3B695_PHYBL
MSSNKIRFTMMSSLLLTAMYLLFYMVSFLKQLGHQSFSFFPLHQHWYIYHIKIVIIILCQRTLKES